MTQRAVTVRRILREEDDPDREYLELTASERFLMMWQLAIDAWTFAGHDATESRFSRHPVVVRR